MNLTKEEISEYKLLPGDILVNRVNSRELVGKAACIPLDLETCVYESKNIRLRLINKYIESKLITFWFLLFSRQFFNRNAQQTVGMASINQDQLGSMPVPLMSQQEQSSILNEVERRFSVITYDERVIDTAIIKSEKLRHTILNKAFQGELLTQDPTDEPADILLQRIKQERSRIEIEIDSERFK